MSLVFVIASCGSRENTPSPKTETSAQNEIDVWITKADETIKLQKQTSILAFTSASNSFQNIDIDVSQTYQTVDGFGYTLTGGSAEVINTLSPSKKQELLQDLFGSGENSIAVSYLRVSIGASDLNSSVFSYNDLEPGQTDINLTKFSLEKDRGVINLLKEILAINPKIKILGSPWSAPVWMKTNGSTIGGSLKPEYYGVYAQYFVKYIQAMKNEGITVDAITIQNEPLHGGNNPSMVMTAEEQANFVKQRFTAAY